MKFAKGTTLSWNSALVGKLTNIGLPELSIDSVDTTTHDSTGLAKTFQAGLVDAGEIQVSGYCEESDTTGQQAMITDAAAGTTRSVVITGPNSLFTCSFNAFITKIKPMGDAPIDGMVSFSASLKISGSPTFAFAASNNLSALSVSNSAVAQPAFAASTYTYVYTVATGVSSVTITPTASAGTITIEANGQTQQVTSGQASSAITLGGAASITPVKITVQEANKAPKIYNLTILRA